MRILVQDAATKVYFDGFDWNEDLARAKAFESVAQAEAFCLQHELSTALIVVMFNDASHDVSYPVGDHNALLVSKPPATKFRRLY